MPCDIADGLQPKRVVVVGATGAIGSAFIFACGSRFPDAEIIGLSRTTTPAIDDTDAASIARAAAHIGGAVDLVFVATGFLHDENQKPEKSLRDLDADQLAKSYVVNTIGPSLVMRYFLPLMPQSGQSVFALLSARVGSISDNRLGGWYGYRSAKAALNQMIQTASIEHGRRWPNACVVGLHPGTVDSGLSKPYQGNVADGALFTPQKSAEYLLDVIVGLLPEDTGKVFDWAGKQVPA